ncbi:MAG: nucleotide pyrophosphatase/phosphodiesterase family protein [Fibrobacteria bacterium]
MHKTVLLNVVGLTPSLIGPDTPRIRRFLTEGWSARLEEQFPAVTCTSQAVMLTGKPPSDNGIVANGWYFKDLAEVGFWKQNNKLVRGEKVFEKLKREQPGFTCAKLFWWYNMYADADWTVTPRPQYPADGRKIFDVYTQPAEIHRYMIQELGPFPFFQFWGPGSGIASSRWIAACAKWIYDRKRPTLSLVYLPHLDYGLQRFGPGAPEMRKELADIDAVVGDLIDYYRERQVRILILSEYGISKVARHTHPNRILRRAGFLEVRPSLTWEMLDAGASAAFAVADHQICHIYVKDKSRIPEVAALFEKEPGQRAVLTGDAIAKAGLQHDRSGDVILMAEPDNWYTYYYWEDDQKAPDFARCVDIHRKPGFDPVELFLDPALKLPKLKVAWTLLKKLLGFRYYMDVIPLTPELVKGSHGTPADKAEEAPMVISEVMSLKPRESSMPMAAVHDLIEAHVMGGDAP